MIRAFLHKFCARAQARPRTLFREYVDDRFIAAIGTVRLVTQDARILVLQVLQALASKCCVISTKMVVIATDGKMPIHVDSLRANRQCKLMPDRHATELTENCHRKEI